MWCATGVNLSGGITKDGGAIVGASVFYNNNNVEDKNIIDNEFKSADDESLEMKKLDEELKVSNILYLNIYTDNNVIINIIFCYYRKIVERILNQN